MGTIIVATAFGLVGIFAIVMLVRFFIRRSQGQKKLEQQEAIKRIRDKELSESNKKLHPNFNGRTSNVNELEMSEDYMIPVKTSNKVNNNS